MNTYIFTTLCVILQSAGVTQKEASRAAFVTRVAG
jgi:hypothetical protein